GAHSVPPPRRAPLSLGASGGPLPPRRPARARRRRDVQAFAARLIVPRLLRAHHVHRAVGRDPIQPGAEVRPRLEAAQLPIRAEETHLEHILAILLVAGYPLVQSEPQPAVPFY